MASLWRYIKSFDSFGEPVQLNYDGDATHKTGCGALFSIAIKSFILVFALTETVKLCSYKDPIISQVRISSPARNTHKQEL